MMSPPTLFKNSPTASPSPSITSQKVVFVWRVEKLLYQLGRGPRAVGQWLDRVGNPTSRTLGNIVIAAIVNFFSSIWLGLLWLLLTGIYIAIGSGFANVRASLEMTDLQFFNAWPMVVLMVLLMLGVTVVTLRRISLTLFTLGSWTVHVGIVLLVIGCFIYFTNKHEGSVRVFLNQSVSHYYDATERALFLRMKGEGGKEGGEFSAALPTWPIYHEHLAELNNGLAIPVSLEGSPLQGLTATVTGYYPCAVLKEEWVAGEENTTGQKSPGILVSMAIGEARREDWLVAASPAGRVLDTANAPLGIEYVDRPSAEKLADLQTLLTGPMGLTVRIPRLHLVKTFTRVQEGEVLKIEGSPYVLRVGTMSYLPLVSKGYEGAESSALMVKVEKTQKSVDSRQEAGEGIQKFERMVLSRYPERSPDFVMNAETGKQQRIQDRVDHNIEIVFHDATRDQFFFVRDEQDRFTLIHRIAGGGGESVPIKTGQAAEVEVMGQKMILGLKAASNHMMKEARSVIIPERQRPAASGVMERIANSMIAVELRDGKGWSHQVYVPFVQFGEMSGPPLALPPAEVQVPGAGVVQLAMSTVKRELPSEVKLTAFEPVKYPGARRTFADYRSTLEVKNRENGTVQTLVTQLNAPAKDQGLYYFQSAWDGDENASPKDRFSVLGVGNRPGISVMVAGSVLMMLGVLYAFYVKPVLVRKKKRMLMKAEG